MFSIFVSRNIYEIGSHALALLNFASIVLNIVKIQLFAHVTGAAPGAIGLLPRHGAAASFTREIPANANAGAGFEEEEFQFDGKTTAVEVPREVVDPEVGGRFTLSTWMRHEMNANDVNPHGTKEHIVCASDGDGM